MTKISLQNVTKYTLYAKEEKNFTSRIKKKIVTIDLNPIQFNLKNFKRYQIVLLIKLRIQYF